MKKLFSILLLILMLFISGCTTVPEGYVRLPNLTGLNREEISKRLDARKINYTFKTYQKVYQDESEYDQFVEYGRGLKAGELIPSDTYVYVYTTVLPLTINRLDEVRQPVDFEEKSFVNDGIGEVTLISSIDGDTAHFRDPITNQYVKVRFLGIDTPEWTKEKEPWGDEAADYTRNVLNQATQIILEAEGTRVDSYDRYLAWVWVDGVLLNLAILQEAYSSSSVPSKSKYYDIFTEVELEVMKTGRRYWGEIDPNYVYK